MQKRRAYLPIALGFFLLCLLIYFFFRGPVESAVDGVFELIFVPIQRTFKGATGSFYFSDKSVAKIAEENRVLTGQLAKEAALEKEVNALRDQFQTSNDNAPKLLPAQIIGDRGFIPGVSMPEELVIDKGGSDGVKVGSVVIYKDNLVGKVSRIGSHAAIITPVSNTATSFAAKTTQTNALGIVKGGGNGVILLTNVVLSDKLQKGDTVVTKGDQDTSGLGFPPDIVVGKITAIDKKPSALFQSAQVETLLDIPKLTTVFVRMNK